MSVLQLIKGNVESKSRKGNSIKVEGEWYSVYRSVDLDHVNWKDDVELLWDWDKTNTYRNIKGTVTVTSATTPVRTTSTSTSPAKRGGFDTTGVEVGHAWNSAVQMALKVTPSKEVGSDKFYKFCIDQTRKIYKINKAIKKGINDPDPVEPPTGELNPALEITLETAKEDALAAALSDSDKDLF